MFENELSYKIRSSIFQVYNNLGLGLLESAHEAALGFELNRQQLLFATHVGLPIEYESIRLNVGYRIDILVENQLIIEVKSVETLLPVHHKQLITYLKLSGLKLGLLVNFNTDDISTSIFRKVNGL